MNTGFTKALVALICLCSWVNGLHFYLKTGEIRCFYEELPKETLAVGKIDVLEYNEHSKDFYNNNDLTIRVTVDETFDNDHRVVDQRVAGSGDFYFTSLDSGEHRICLSPVYKGGNDLKYHRIQFDLALGSAHDYADSKSTRKVDDLTRRVQSLNKKLEEIHLEQELMREREAVFRDQSEATNSRVVKWTLVQLFVLIGTCVYQLRHLKSFFVKQKIV